MVEIGRQPTAGSVKACSPAVPPLVKTVTVAPNVIGSPTTTSGLPDSLPSPSTFRRDASPFGSDTMILRPRIVWSAARTRPATTDVATSASTVATAIFVIGRTALDTALYPKVG